MFVRKILTDMSEMKKVFIAIRDDDINFWTKPNDLEKLYGDFFNKGGKVSLAVIPYSWKQVNPGVESAFYIEKDIGRKYIFENKELVDYLTEKIKENRIEIMLHGFDHVYGVKFNGEVRFLDKLTREEINQTKVKYEFIPECIYKSPEELEKDLRMGKQILEDTFGIEIKVFVPPGNALSKDCVGIVAKLGMNISGIVGKTFNRPLSLKSLINFSKKIYWRVRYGLPYPFVMDYGTHKELVAYALTPATNIKKLEQIYEMCKNLKAPFTISTHYWEVLKNETLLQTFKKFLEKLDISRVTFLKDIFEK